MKYIISLSILFLSISIQAQETFEFMITNSISQLSRSVIEKENGNFLITMQSKDGEANNIPMILEVSRNGELLQNTIIPYEDTLSYVPHYIEMTGDTLMILGEIRYTGKDYPWYCTLRSNDMSLIKSKILWESAPFSTLMDIQKISGDRYTFVGFRNDTTAYFDGYVSIINRQGALLNDRIYPVDSSHIPAAILEKSDHSGFILKGGSTSLILLDNGLEIDSIINSPYGFGTYSFLYNTMRRLDDSTHLISGVHAVSGDNNDESIGIKKVRHTNQVINDYVFGTPDSLEITAINQSLDFLYPDKIYCGGWQREIGGHPFISELPGWLILSQLDEDLNPNWTRYYGGDAYYVMSGVLATRDGGCLIYGRRYDFTGIFEYDVYLLKVGPDGLLTSTEVPEMGTSGITVYPNPATHYMVFDTGVAGQYDLLVFDALGKVVLSKEIPNNRPIDIRHLPAGSYTYLLTQKNKVTGQGKWIKK